MNIMHSFNFLQSEAPDFAMQLLPSLLLPLLLMALLAAHARAVDPTIESSDGSVSFTADKNFLFTSAANGSLDLFAFVAETQKQLASLQAQLQDKQKRVDGSCYRKGMVAVNADGSVQCSDDIGSSKGDIVGGYRKGE